MIAVISWFIFPKFIPNFDENAKKFHDIIWIIYGLVD